MLQWGPTFFDSWSHEGYVSVLFCCKRTRYQNRGDEEIEGKMPNGVDSLFPRGRGDGEDQVLIQQRVSAQRMPRCLILISVCNWVVNAWPKLP